MRGNNFAVSRPIGLIIRAESKKYRATKKKREKMEIGQCRRAGGYLQRGGSNANPDVQVFWVVDALKQNKDRL